MLRWSKSHEGPGLHIGQKVDWSAVLRQEGDLLDCGEGNPWGGPRGLCPRKDVEAYLEELDIPVE
jgi:hypothetical protein